MTATSTTWRHLAGRVKCLDVRRSRCNATAGAGQQAGTRRSLVPHRSDSAHEGDDALPDVTRWRCGHGSTHSANWNTQSSHWCSLTITSKRPYSQYSSAAAIMPFKMRTNSFVRFWSFNFYFLVTHACILFCMFRTCIFLLWRIKMLNK